MQKRKSTEVTMLVARLLDTKEVESVAGGEYARNTADYCQYTQGKDDQPYSQDCTTKLQ